MPEELLSPFVGYLSSAGARSLTISLRKGADREVLEKDCAWTCLGLFSPRSSESRERLRLPGVTASPATVLGDQYFGTPSSKPHYSFFWKVEDLEKKTLVLERVALVAERIFLPKEMPADFPNNIESMYKGEVKVLTVGPHPEGAAGCQRVSFEGWEIALLSTLERRCLFGEIYGAGTKKVKDLQRALWSLKFLLASDWLVKCEQVFPYTIFEPVSDTLRTRNRKCLSWLLCRAIEEAISKNTAPEVLHVIGPIGILVFGSGTKENRQFLDLAQFILH